MDIVIAGGHGKIALQLERLLADAEHRVRGLIRNPEHDGDLREAGAEPVLADLEALDVDALDDADRQRRRDRLRRRCRAGAAAPQRKWTLDYAGAVKLMEVGRRNGIDRYVIVSAMSADPEAGTTAASGPTCAPRAGPTRSSPRAAWRSRSSRRAA